VPHPNTFGARRKGPVAIQGQMEIRPMMYVALTYDHRLADGQDAVGFLVRLKQFLEDPIQSILEI